MTKPRRKTPPPPPRARKSKPSAKGIRIVLVIAGIAIAAWTVWQQRRPAPGPRPPVSAAEALARAQAFERSGDMDAALEAYRDGVTRFPGDHLLLGHYGTAVTNRGFEVRTLRGRLVPVVPTSLERVREARAALAAFDAAEKANPRSANPPRMRGLLYAAWGLPEDALLDLYRATVRGDTSAAVLNAGDAITQLQFAGEAPPPNAARR